jgi:DNA helicase-2/ATP-dependent DNA helicase PcrA
MQNNTANSLNPQVVSHPEVTSFLRNCKDKQFVKQVLECIEKLVNYQFDGGLRVKKLRGSSNKIWEARINSASRLLFTYNKSLDTKTGQRTVYRTIQDVCIDHDDVSRYASRRARSQTIECQWLDSENIEILIGDLDKSNQQLSEEQREFLDVELEDELTISQEAKDELLSNIQWEILPNSRKEWEEAILENRQDFSLKLTPEEYKLVDNQTNLLLKGSAGTGKTTIGLYRLKQFAEYRVREMSSGNSLYVAYNPILVKNTQEQFQRLLGIKSGDTKTENCFQFKTIQELCLSLLETYNKHFDKDEEVKYNTFLARYSKHRQSKKYPAPLVWTEIRSLIKGSIDPRDLGNKFLSLADYENLSAKFSHVIQKQDRPEIHKIAQWYQKEIIHSERRFDEIDIARELLGIVNIKPYDLIVCDEVQDLTNLQIELLIKLLKPHGYLYFAGDEYQMISPSGFRWESLSTSLYSKGLKKKESELHRQFKFEVQHLGSF